MPATLHWRHTGAQLLPGVLLFLLMLFASRFPLPYLDSSLPLLPALAAVYYWSLFRPACLPLSALAVLSLLHDVLYGLPMGCSLLLFLAARFISGWMRGRMLFEQFMLVWVMFAPIMLCLLLLLAFAQHWVEGIAITQLIQAYDMPFFISWCSYPLFHLLFNWCYHQLPQRP